MHALAAQSVEINRQGGHKGFALAGFHLGDLAFMQHHAADQLDIKMALAEGALGGLSDGGEGLHQKVIKRFALGADLPAVFIGEGAKFVVGEFFQLRLNRIDLLNPLDIVLEFALV